MSDFDVYLESLSGSWEALAMPHGDARVIHDSAFVASISPSYPILNNAVLLDASGVKKIQSAYASAGPYAVWSHQPATARALEVAGFAPDEITHPMVCHLDSISDTHPEAGPVVARADVEQVALLNEVESSLLVGVPGIRAYATEQLDSVALFIEVGSDVNVSFVVTRPERRRRGLAAYVLEYGLRQARADGFVTSSLQATSMARSVYSRLGYCTVARWQEWRLSER